MKLSVRFSLGMALLALSFTVNSAHAGDRYYRGNSGVDIRIDACGLLGALTGNRCGDQGYDLGADTDFEEYREPVRRPRCEPRRNGKYLETWCFRNGRDVLVKRERIRRQYQQDDGYFVDQRRDRRNDGGTIRPYLGNNNGGDNFDAPAVAPYEGQQPYAQPFSIDPDSATVN